MEGALLDFWMAPPWESVFFLGLALLFTLGGFYRVVYFVSLGYGFSIASMAIAAAALFHRTLDVPTGLQCALLGLYGLRLGGFLLKRELHPSYRGELSEVKKRGEGLSLAKRLLIWVGVSLLYVLMFSPCLFNLLTRRASPAPAEIFSAPFGVVIMAVGLVLEALADWQKSAFKARQPDRFCDVGLYRFVRCPNYLGEMLFWTGGFVAGISGYSSASRWIAAVIGTVCIVLIMIGSTKRLEATQDVRYGTDESYRAYVQTVPVLIPFVPVYSLKSVRVYLE